jgi:hypothetical protein
MAQVRELGLTVGSPIGLHAVTGTEAAVCALRCEDAQDRFDQRGQCPLRFESDRIAERQTK